jgi:hypothetical protein
LAEKYARWDAKGGTMDTVHSEINGYTFTTSQRGIRNVWARHLLLGIAFVTGRLIANGWPTDNVDWSTGLFFLFLWGTCGYMFILPSIRNASFRIENTDVVFVRNGRDRRHSLAGVKRIFVERSQNGDRRNISVWDRTGDVYKLQEPDNGATLERWVTEEAPQYRIPVSILYTKSLSWEFTISFFLWTGAAIVGHLSVYYVQQAFLPTT